MEPHPSGSTAHSPQPPRGTAPALPLPWSQSGVRGRWPREWRKPQCSRALLQSNVMNWSLKEPESTFMNSVWDKKPHRSRPSCWLRYPLQARVSGSVRLSKAYKKCGGHQRMVFKIYFRAPVSDSWNRAGVRPPTPSAHDVWPDPCGRCRVLEMWIWALPRSVWFFHRCFVYVAYICTGVEWKVRDDFQLCLHKKRKNKYIYVLFSNHSIKYAWIFSLYLFVLPQSWKSPEMICQELIGELILLFSIIATTSVEFNEVLTFPLQKSNPGFLYHTLRDNWVNIILYPL